MTQNSSTQEPAGPSTLLKPWTWCCSAGRNPHRRSSSQCRTTAIGRGSLLKSVETAGGVATSSPSIAPPSPPRREFCAEASPTDRDRGQDCLRLLFHYARHSEREYLKDNSKLATSKDQGCSAEDFGWLEATIEIDSLFRGHRLLVLAVSSTLRGALH